MFSVLVVIPQQNPCNRRDFFKLAPKECPRTAPTVLIVPTYQKERLGFPLLRNVGFQNADPINVSHKFYSPHSPDLPTKGSFVGSLEFCVGKLGSLGAV